VALTDTLMFAAVLVLFFYKGISYRFRAGAFVLLTYVLGMVLLAVLDTEGAGPAWLFLFPVAAGILLGFRTSLVCLGINVLTMTGFSLLEILSMDGSGEISARIFQMVVVGLNFLLLNTIATLSLVSVFKGLTSAMASQSESRAKYRRIFENILDVYFEIDLHGRILEISPSADSLFPREPGASDPEPLLFRYAEPARTGIFFSRIRREGEVQNFEMRFLLPGRDPAVCSLNARVISDEWGKPLSVVGILRDISRWKTVQEENRRLEEKLARSEKMEALGLMAGGVAHDLNNILSGIVAYPELILEDLPEGHHHRKYLLAVKEAGERAAAVLDDLLNLARRGVVQRQILDFHRLVRDFLDSPECRGLLARNPRSRVTGDLGAGPLFLKGSAVHLHKLVMNLVANGLEAQTGGGEVRVSLRVLTGETGPSVSGEIPRGNYLALSVEDQGRGISPEDLPRIFEPFFTRKVMGYSGTGLGMAVVWGTVQDHQGYIRIRSVRDRGTLMEILLPYDSLDEPPEFLLEEGRHLTGKGETVLVVDDMQEQREVNRRLLEKLNYRVLTASSGEEALQVLESYRAEAVLLDMIMGEGMDGMSTFQEIRRRIPGQKVLMLSGYAESSRVEAVLAAGMTAFLRKPCSLERLGTVLREVLNS